MLSNRCHFTKVLTFPVINSSISQLERLMMAEAESTSVLLKKPKHKALKKYHDLHKEWYFLGVELEVGTKELNKIRNENSDDRMKMIIMFGVWLEKGENPTYRKLLKALVEIDRKDIAQSICTDLGK